MAVSIPSLTRSVARLRRLSGLLWESDPYVLSADETAAQEDAEDDARYHRERHIVGLITHVFHRLGIALADPEDEAIFYSEDDRAATVHLDDSEITVARLIRLQKSGLSTNYLVQIGSGHALDIVFVVSPALDQSPPPDQQNRITA